LIIGACALAVSAGVWLWTEVLDDHFIPKRWGVVEPGLIYRSGQLDSWLVEKTLASHHIATIVSLTGDVPYDKNQQAERSAAAKLGIDLQRYPLAGDGTGDIHNYAQAIAAIVQAAKSGRAVLIHCAAGSQRTGGVVAFYRLLVERRPAQAVYRELRRYGWKPKDKPLIEYVNRNMGPLAELLVTMGVIADVPSPLPTLKGP
jgi:protein tyrosine/serine phosphatase